MLSLNTPHRRIARAFRRQAFARHDRVQERKRGGEVESVGGETIRESICSFNHYSPVSVLRPGQHLMLPAPGQ